MISLKQLAQQLNSVYLISGDEPYLKLQASTQICKEAKAQGFIEHQTFNMDAQFDFKALYEALYNMSLFGDKGIVELRLAEKLSEEVRELLVSYAQNPLPEKVLLIIAPKLDSNTQKSKWYQEIAAAGVVVQIWPIEYTELPAWIIEQLQGAGLKASKEAIKLLAEKGENNLTAIAQAIEKLKLLNIQTEVTPEDILKCLGDNASYDIFQFANTVLQGDLVRLKNIFTGLKNQDVEAILILWAMVKDIRVLAEVNSGQELNTVMSKRQVWRNRQALLKNAFQRHSASFWQQCIVKANHIDMIIKGVKPGNVWDELFSLCLKIAKKPASQESS